MLKQAEFKLSDLRKKELWEVTTPSLKNHITILQVLIAGAQPGDPVAQLRGKLAEAQAELAKREAGVS